MCHADIQDMLHDRDALKRHITDILRSRQRRIIPKENLREAAVLIPLCWDGADPFVLVTKRSMSVENHKGEISFPGGSSEESDEGLVFTALREAEEEIGLESRDVEVLGLLDDHISIVGYHITPVVGVVPCPYEFTINSESEILLFASLSTALKDTVWMAEKTTFMGKDINIYYLQIEGGVIWGATARILKHFVDLIAGRTIPFGEVSPEAKAWVKDLLTLQAGYRADV
jgi:8-oxo-dGTP pyrophosphatase MutT (NUDIX family)